VATNSSAYHRFDKLSIHARKFNSSNIQEIKNDSPEIISLSKQRKWVGRSCKKSNSIVQDMYNS
jgi:hypothetical protein